MPKKGYKQTEDHKRKLSENSSHFWLGKHHSELTKEKLKIFNLGKKLSEEIKRKISERHKGINTWSKGKIISKETREKLRLANTGKKRSEETKKRISNSHKGKKFSDEHKKNLSISMRSIRKNKIGYWKGKKRPLMSNEHRKKISIGNTGKKHSQKTKEKLRKYHILYPIKKFKDTKIELKVEKELQNRQINYQKQVPLCNIANVDFYLPEYKIIIQCDGCYWHGCPIHHPDDPTNKKNNDIKKDLILLSNGYKIYRFWEHEINESVEKCIDRILF